MINKRQTSFGGPVIRHPDGYYYIGSARLSEKSAEFVLRSMSKSQLSRLSRIVLEGAPGQGKSTITQYVCQVMRMHLLGKETALEALPKQHRSTRVRIPFRVDLRDLAKWMVGTDPFQSKPAKISDDEPKSFEGFLAAQLRFVSGGHQFTVSDLSAVARASHIFLALDGFDEVADVEVRRYLVSEISRGTTRLLNAGGFSIQTVVTSRPAAFTKSVRFPREQWTYFELLPLERKEVESYTWKWMRAKGLKEAEKTAFRRNLDSKLREAHTISCKKPDAVDHSVGAYIQPWPVAARKENLNVRHVYGSVFQQGGGEKRDRQGAL
jgi:hypothetical protein